MEPVAGIQILRLPSGEDQITVRGVTLERFQSMVCAAIATVTPKLIEQEQAQKGQQIQVPSPALAAKLAGGRV